MEDEHAHEQKLIGMIEEERLSYVGSVVLGLNDALVELTGALAGFTFALQNTRLIANYFICLAITLGIAMLIIFFFNFYISVAKDYSFRRRFLEMAGLSLGQPP